MWLFFWFLFLAPMVWCSFNATAEKHIAFSFPPSLNMLSAIRSITRRNCASGKWNTERPFSGQTDKKAEKKMSSVHPSIHPSVFPSALRWVGPTSTGSRRLCPRPLSQVQWTCWTCEPRLPPSPLSMWRVWPSLQGRVRLPSSSVRMRPDNLWRDVAWQPANVRGQIALQNIGKKNKLIKTFLCFAALLTATCRPHLSGQCACREPFPSLWNR